MDQDVRVAIVGYGLAGRVFHGPLVSSTPGMTVAAIVSSNPERRGQARRDYPDAMLLDSPDEIWQRAAEFDLVVVATPNIAHAPLATTSMESGIAVVVDKPMALSVDEADRLIATSGRTGVPLTVFQNRRWDGDFQTVFALMGEMTIGEVIRVESRFERYRPVVRTSAWREQTSFEEGGGLLWDLGSHLIDQALELFGVPVEVYAEMPCRRDGAMVDDDTFVALTFPYGEIAHLWMSVLARAPGPRFRVQGLRGTYEKYGLDVQEEALKNGVRPGMAGWGEEPASAWGHVVTQTGEIEYDGRIRTLPGAYEEFYQRVRDALRDGHQMPVHPWEARETVRIIVAARESAQSQSTVRFKAEYR